MLYKYREVYCYRSVVRSGWSAPIHRSGNVFFVDLIEDFTCLPLWRAMSWDICWLCSSTQVVMDHRRFWTTAGPYRNTHTHTTEWVHVGTQKTLPVFTRDWPILVLVSEYLHISSFLSVSAVSVLAVSKRSCSIQYQWSVRTHNRYDNGKNVVSAHP